MPRPRPGRPSPRKPPWPPPGRPDFCRASARAISTRSQPPPCRLALSCPPRCGSACASPTLPILLSPWPRPQERQRCHGNRRGRSTSRDHPRRRSQTPSREPCCIQRSATLGQLRRTARQTPRSGCPSFGYALCPPWRCPTPRGAPPNRGETWTPRARSSACTTQAFGSPPLPPPRAPRGGLGAATALAPEGATLLAPCSHGPASRPPHRWWTPRAAAT
mmetsp:Transcript_36859/g.105914  ORF Transcript_36859/g.105914 Transcript_36859/m.105914 type:complete len:219 (+) Transcript_36859:507-1163(+)